VTGHRKAGALVLAGILGAACIVLAGRWEQHRSARTEMARMRIVLAAVGPLDHATATGYRLGAPRCLAYSTPQNRFGLQLCWDAVGRLVETVDRRGAQPVYASLNYQPSLSTIRFAKATVDGMFTRAVG
jgi:hypothetical protein